jgi:hypothetical protein
VGGGANHVFTVSNTGGVPATGISEVGLAAPFTYVGGSYPGTGGTCAGSLANGSSCDIAVRYAPSSTGTDSDLIEFSYNNGVTSTTSTRQVQGSGVPAAILTISGANPEDFGNVTVGNNDVISLTVTNTGGLTATSMAGGGLVAPFTFEGGSYPGTTGTCTTSLTAGSNCTISLRFQPTMTGLASDIVEIDYNDGVVVQTANMISEVLRRIRPTNKSLLCSTPATMQPPR